jgi:predicted ester cyclase
MSESELVDLKWKANLIDRIYASRKGEEIANKAILCRYVEATNVGDLDELDNLVVEDFVEHEPIPGQPQGREGLKWAYKVFLDPFPDVKFIFDDVIGDGDLVVGRGVISATHTGPFFGVPATNKRVHWTGTRLFRMKDGRMTDGWVAIDMLGLMQQMGVVPAPPQPDPSTLPPAKHITGAPSTREANRKLVERFIEEVWNKGNFDVADEIFHPEATSPSAPTLPPGGEGVRVIAGMFRSAFPDYSMEITHIVAEEDRVAARFLQGGTHQGELFGIPATGKTARWSEIGILRVADGKVVESWYDVDLLGMMQQLGVGGQQ